MQESKIKHDDIDSFINTLDFSVRGCYGTNTPCVEVKTENGHLILDAGTGLRDLGNHGPRSDRCDILLSHLHWDHIHGFPFFTPAYSPNSTINIYGFHDRIRQAFKIQQSQPFFPVSLDAMPARIKFKKLKQSKNHKIAGFNISGHRQDHPGGSYAYRIEKANKTIIYATDSEYKDLGSTNNSFLDFIRFADLLIFDSQYSLLNSLHTKENWGHSSNITAVEIAIDAQVKHLCLFHSEPVFNDSKLDSVLRNSIHYRDLYKKDPDLKISMAYDGLEIEI